MVNFSNATIQSFSRSGDTSTNDNDNPFELEDTNNTASNEEQQDDAGVEELFMVDIPSAAEVSPPSWMSSMAVRNSPGKDAAASALPSPPPPPDQAFNFHREHPSTAAGAASLAGGGDIGSPNSTNSVSSESINSNSKRRKSKKKSPRNSIADQDGDQHTILTMASSASAANPDGSRRRRDDREAMLEAMERTSSRRAIHPNDSASVSSSASGAGNGSSSVVSGLSGRSSLTTSSRRSKRRSKMSSDKTVIPGMADVSPRSSRDEHDNDRSRGDNFEEEYDGTDKIDHGPRISSDLTESAEDIIDMCSRGEVLSDVQIHHPDAAAGSSVQISKPGSFGKGGRKSSNAGRALANFAETPDEFNDLEAPSQGNLTETTKHRSNTEKKHKHKYKHHKHRGKRDHRGDRSEQQYGDLALADGSASVDERLRYGWGRNEIDTGGGATDVPSPEMVARVGISSSSQRRSSSIASSSAAIDAIKKLGKSVARRVSDYDVRSSMARSISDARYPQVEAGRGSADLGQSKSSSPPGGLGSARGSEDMEEAVAKYMFEDSEVKDFDTAEAELAAKRKQRERLTKNEWGDGTRRTSSFSRSDAFRDDMEIHEEGYCDNGKQRRSSRSRAKIGPVTSWAFLADRYVVQTKNARRIDDDCIIDDEDLNDNTDSPRGHGDLDVMGWSMPTNIERRKKRQCIFWVTTTVVVGVAIMIGGLLIASGRTRVPNGGESQTSTPPVPAPIAEDLSPKDGSTPSTEGPGTLGGKHMFTDDDVQKLLTQITPESILTNPTTPQYAAMQWVLDDLDTSIIYVAESGTTDRILQRYTLAVIYHSTLGPWGAWMTDELWLTEDDECDWFGVRCGVDGENEERATQQGGVIESQVLVEDEDMIEEGSYVTYLDLSENGLQGSLPDEIGTLSKLSQLLLFGNEIGGKIPESLTKLSNLHTLYLNRNKLTGSITDSIGDLINLKNFDVSDNKLSSTIPNAFGNLGSLVDLRLSNNDFTGGFPLEIADLNSLTTLLANGNSIGGTLPEALGSQLKNLTVLRLQGNELFGNIPTFESPALEELHLDNNAFGGPINLPKSKLLREFFLGKNLLQGPIPSNIAQVAPSLEIFDLSFNQLSGDIPSSSLAQLTSAKEIRLNGNSALSGSVDAVCDALPNIGATLRVDLPQVTCKCCDCC